MKLLMSAMAASVLGGCALDPGRTVHRGNVLLDGVGADIDPAQARLFSINQDYYLSVFAHDANLPNFPIVEPPDASAQSAPQYASLAALTDQASWKQVTNAGVIYIGQQCEDYLHALWELNRARQATNTEITTIGTLVTAILGAAQASAPAIAITASSFGFASATSENFYSSLLYQLDQSSVDALVHNSQLTVKGSISSSEQASTAASPAWGRNETVSALTQYLNVCLPQTIEAGVNAATKGASVTIPQTPTTPPPGGTKPTPPPSAGPLGSTSVQVNAPSK
jgi:hypothetical protein